MAPNLGGLAGPGAGSITGSGQLGFSGLPMSLSSMAGLLGGSGSAPTPYAQAVAPSAIVNNLNANPNESPLGGPLGGSVFGTTVTSTSTGLLGAAPTSLSLGFSLAPGSTGPQGPSLVAPTPLAGGAAPGGISGSTVALARPPSVQKQNGSTSESLAHIRFLTLHYCFEEQKCINT